MTHLRIVAPEPLEPLPPEVFNALVGALADALIADLRVNPPSLVGMVTSGRGTDSEPDREKAA